jgi:hypothetical protein
MLKIPSTTLTLEEAIYLLEHHREGGYFDAGGYVILFEAKDLR